jgi:hypothetical protein
MTSFKTITAARFGGVAIALVGIIHLVLASEYFEEEPYIGYLFVAGGAGALLVAVGLWRGPQRLAWALGAVIAVGMGVGFVLSRTVGLPGFHETEWESSGIASLVLEVAYLVGLVRASRSAPVQETPSVDPRRVMEQRV